MSRTLALLAAAALLLGALPAGAAAYSWPVKPFFQPHPIRGQFGDPRTVFIDTADTDGLTGPGSFTFHNGVDITAAYGTPVYPVLSGTAHLIAAGTVAVVSKNATQFQYQHVTPAVKEGQHVVARRTVLGHVEKWAGHVHLSEIRHGALVNPLLKGHLSPYRDTTKPWLRNFGITSIQTGQPEALVGVHGSVMLTVEAYDRPDLASPAPWARMPVTPAIVGWRMTTLAGKAVVPGRKIFDVTRALPAQQSFWSVFARGTYQNNPRFNRQVYTGLPGRYIFNLTPLPIDTHQFPNGIYQVTASAYDVRGHRATLTTRIAIRNVY
jgi:hypothetical protein